MKKTLKDLFGDYISSPSLETQTMIAEFYVGVKSDNERIEVEKEIKEFLQQDLPQGGISWYNFFQVNTDFWADIFLINQEKRANQCVERVKNQDLKSRQFFIENSVEMCDIMCENTRDVEGLSKRVQDVWVKEFSSFPEFQVLLETYRKEKEEFLQKFINEFNSKKPKEHKKP